MELHHRVEALEATQQQAHIAECGGPCEQGPEHCDCGQLMPAPRDVIDPAKEGAAQWIAARLAGEPTPPAKPAPAGGLMGRLGAAWNEGDAALAAGVLRAVADGWKRQTQEQPSTEFINAVKNCILVEWVKCRQEKREYRERRIIEEVSNGQS